MALDCLSGLVGLAERDCPCLSAGFPSGSNSSESGYYLDDRVHGYPVKDAVYQNLDCGESTIWDVLDEARNQAIRDVKVDVRQALETIRESKIVNWEGLIGKAEGVGSLVSTSTYSGIQLRPKYRQRDAVFTIRALHIYLGETKSVNVRVSSNDNTFTTVTESAAVTGNTWHRFVFSTAVELPLYSINVSDIRYNILIEPDGATVKQNKLFCCSGAAWQKHFDAGAFNQATIPDDQETTPTLTVGYGLAIEGYFSCNDLDWICNLDVLGGLKFKDLVARLIQWKAAMHLITNTLRSNKVNKHTLLDKEGLYRQRSHLHKEYSNAVIWLSQNLPGDISSCWGCTRNAPRIQELII